jgi:F-type H+-transporting ATPase subunit epsilon
MATASPSPVLTDTLHLTVVTPTGVVFDGGVQRLWAMTPEGSIGIEPKHQPLVTPLAIGLIKPTLLTGTTEVYVVMGGLLDTDGHRITILTDNAEQGHHIDRVRAEQALRRAQDRLRHKQGIDVTRAELALRRALARLEAVK